MADVVVWWAPATSSDGAIGLLNDRERVRLDMLRQPEDRTMFVAAHVLLRQLIAHLTGTAIEAVDVVQHCDRCGGAHGQPRVVIGGAPGPAVSLAHASGIVAAARASHPVGVDLERAGHVGLDVAPAVLAPSERANLDEAAASGRAVDLTRTWVRKEAVLKAAGTGMLADPRDLVLSPPSAPPRVERWSHRGPWSLADLDLAPGFTAAVAVRAVRMPPITVRRADVDELS